MAKVTFLQGSARGKVGGIVYRNVAGIGTVASEYQPSVHNPRTLAQTVQRSKMNLAGQLSKVTPYEAIAGLASSKRQARSRFVSNILRMASETTPNAGSMLSQSALVLSEGTPLPITGTMSNVDQSGNIEIVVVIPEAITAVMGGILVVYASADNNTPICACYKMVANELTKSIPIMSLVREGTQQAIVSAYFVPIVDKGDSSRVAFGQLEMSLPGYGTAYTRTLVSAGAYARSVLLAVNTFDLG